MAEFALVGDDGGHSWNNTIAHASYADNASRFGEETARQLLRADISSWIRERRGEASRWSLSVRDGKMVTETGVSLSEMTDNITHGPHSNLVPENIKATAHLEAATLEEATRLAVAGAERIVLPEQHLDAQGNVVSRYLSVWTKSALDPTRYDGSRIDLGKNIRIEDVRTGTSFTAFEEREGISFHQHRDQKHAFVLAFHDHANVPFEAMKDAIMTKIHRSHQETYLPDHRADTSQKEERSRWVQSEHQRVQGEVSGEREALSAPKIPRHRHTDLLIDVPRAVVRNTAETVRGVAVFLRGRYIQKESDTERRVHKEDLHVRLREKQTERLTIAKIREKPVKVVEAIQKRHSEMKKGMAVLGVIAETGIAVHATPVILARFIEKLPAPIRAVEKSMRRHAEKVRKAREVRKVREGRKSSGKAQPLQAEKVDSLEKGKERKKRKKRAKGYREMTASSRRYTIAERIGRKEQGRRAKQAKEIGVKKVVGAEKLIPMELAKPKNSMKQEKRERRRLRRLRHVSRRAERIVETKHLSKREKKLWVALAVVATEYIFEKKRGEQRKELGWEQKERKRSMKRNERVAIAGAWFTWAVWMIFEKKNVLSEKIVSKKLVYKEHKKQEPTPWILLSIIWYLTMLREQGMHNTTNTTNNQMKTRQIVLPQQGIIFVRAPESQGYEQINKKLSVRDSAPLLWSFTFAS